LDSQIKATQQKQHINKKIIARLFDFIGNSQVDRGNFEQEKQNNKVQQEGWQGKIFRVQLN
jgi:hypothetical protein